MKKPKIVEQAIRPTMLGKVANAMRLERWTNRELAVKQLWERNNLLDQDKRYGYKVESNTQVDKSGAETTIFNLWRLVDRSIVTVTPRVTSEIKNGLEEADDGIRETTPTHPNDSPI